MGSNEQELEVSCCFCFFDDCLLSYEKKDSFQQTFKKLWNVIDKEYEAEKAKDLCTCSICKPPRYCLKLWNFRTYSMIREYRYFACYDHVIKSLKNASMTVKNKFDLHGVCCHKALFKSSYERYMNTCYFYWVGNLINIFGF